jgi:hypothetical protein
LKSPRQIIDLVKFVANGLTDFTEAPLLVDIAEAEAKCDQGNRGYPEGPIGPIQEHATILQHFSHFENGVHSGRGSAVRGNAAEFAMMAASGTTVL